MNEIHSQLINDLIVMAQTHNNIDIIDLKIVALQKGNKDDEKAKTYIIRISSIK